MNKKKKFGIFLLILATMLATFQGFRITGNIIGEYTEIGFGFLTTSLYIVGFVLVFSTDKEVNNNPKETKIK